MLRKLLANDVVLSHGLTPFSAAPISPESVILYFGGSFVVVFCEIKILFNSAFGQFDFFALAF